MQLSKQKTIAFFIARPMAEYQQKLIGSFTKLAAEHGYYTLVFTCFGGYGDNEYFLKGERYLAQLPEYEAFSAIVLAIDTFEEPVIEKMLIDNIRTRAKCPVVCIRRAVEGFHSILVDDKNSMEGIVRHLLGEHGYRDVCYVGGPENHPDAINRLECFQRVCAEYDVSIGLDSIYYGNFWRNRGEEIVHYLLEGRQKQPEAIVCANDYMAISVCNALYDRGIRVPEDIAVTGFDNISESEAMIPSLSTVDVDTGAMAECAMRTIERLRKGEEVSQRQYVPTKAVLRESCGCKKGERSDFEQSVRNYYEMLQEVSNHTFQSSFMALDGGAADDLDALNQVIYRYVFNNYRFRDFLIALCDYDWNHGESEMFSGFTPRMHLRTVIQNNLLLGHVDHVFDKADILPAEFLCDTPCTYLMVPLHYRNQCFGYAMINFWENTLNGTFFQYFIMNISNTLENIRIRRKMGTLIRRLQDLSVSDELTGLYNRYGFEEQSKEMYRTAVKEGRSLVIVSIDMDGLKNINDTYGHAHGDVALKAIANAISSAGFSGERYYRVGGDEFQMLAMDYTEEMMARYRERLDGFLTDYNRRSKRPYIVQASLGYALCDPAEARSLQEWMTLSDKRMYQHKESRRAARKIIRE
ncbi:MAG: GGDEF domain-containing protein [Lachnospiraceae bacterium]|nr:GGDEF domain-containing protein [Lachnospiraceae bacterium]